MKDFWEDAVHSVAQPKQTKTLSPHLYVYAPMGPGTHPALW